MDENTQSWVILVAIFLHFNLISPESPRGWHGKSQLVLLALLKFLKIKKKQVKYHFRNLGHIVILNGKENNYIIKEYIFNIITKNFIKYKLISTFFDLYE